MTVQARDGYIAKSNLNPALKFSFTPVDYEERSKIDKANRDAADNPEKKTALTCAMIKKHLFGWDANQSHLFSFNPASDKADPDLPLTSESIRRLKPILVDSLFLVILGAMASDPVPGATDKEAEDYGDMLIKAAAENVSPGTAAAEREVGNS